MTRFLQAGLCRICVDVKEKMARRAKLADLYNAEFTLQTYARTTRQKQDEAAQAMGNLMAQVQ